MNGIQQIDLLIVGAGPAGLSAAATISADRDFRVMIIDEFPEPGGRLLGQFHEERDRSWWVGKTVAADLIAQNVLAGVTIQSGVSVYGLELLPGGWKVLTSKGDIHTKYLLLATGAAEIPVPVSGWTLPGVMSIGAAQVMANVHQVKPGEKGYIVGVNVLSLAIARELAVAGIEIEGIALPPSDLFVTEETTPVAAIELLTRISDAAPALWMRLGGKLAQKMKLSRLLASCFPKKGIKVWDLPLQLRTALVSIQGVDQVESVVVADVTSSGEIIEDSQREIKVDFVAIAGGLYPLAELAALAGCPFLYVPELGGNIPIHNERMKTTLPNLYVAGNITGVEGAQVAMAQGRLAAHSISYDDGWFACEEEPKLLDAIDEVKEVRNSAMIQFHPEIDGARKRIYELFDHWM
ncbi:sarcosine oxidase subunit alpha [Thermoactinomyces sp. DSM 45891]|uniref:NAD(P)/FAD-dependent oxidoreductase n=1 Tax=Thermoactinomyces sp. DSM 45891 TaxID=1761907 RepID=UPI0009125697|nr:FAD-dependent oxidoreductase [Thermoactinomyces sp. DSM 45891]SFX03592.1 sarcosine oxidase subunit alpha [Thermoactinomyces sp. DSM 45891]